MVIFDSSPFSPVLPAGGGLMQSWKNGPENEDLLSKGTAEEKLIRYGL